MYNIEYKSQSINNGWCFMKQSIQTLATQTITSFTTYPIKKKKLQKSIYLH